MKKRPLTPAYIFFYILFSPDTWRILSAAVLAFLLAPALTATRELNRPAQWVVYAMVAGIGYGLSGLPARKLAAFLRRRVLGTGR